MKPLPFQTVDYVIPAVILLSQVGILRVLWRDGKGRIPVPLFRTLVVLLAAMWPVILYGIVLNDRRMIFRGSALPMWTRTLSLAVAMVWGSTASLSLGIYLVFRKLTRKAEAAGFSPGRRKIIQGVGATAMVAPFATAAFGGIVERTAFEVKEVEIRIANLHPDLEGLRIAQISDLHVSPYLSVKELGRAVDMTNELRPYLTVVTGDLISMPGDPLDDTIRELARLRAEHGVLGCLGNHEVYAKAEEYTRVQAARYGIDFLRFKNREIKRGAGVMNVAGVDFQHFDWRSHYIAGTENLVLPGMPNILLSHNPDVFPTAARKGFDLTLAGHTHGGQVTVEIVNQTANLARFYTQYVAGLYRQGEKSCYVNAGIGTIGMPVRLGAPPEITLLRLVRA